ncbi:uncharacterized protein Dwil_GK10560, isoform B [Drosophila willistoni]|uniref:Uncharacterized protein, isoform B n=1 Tax=Drosophila willistoni TaxID=7260 RepID=A0A0Q9WW46_DROWI|nr:uncharacterized protein Dwil_GK10560, isoform B [Drosophila willistoni]
MAAYTQFGYGGFPPVSQLMPPNVTHASEDASSNVNESSLVMTNAPALSPTGGMDSQTNQQAAGSGGDASSGALSPNSNAAAGSVVGGAAGTDLATGGSLDGNAVGTTPTTGSSCCENGRPIMTDPVSGQTVCSCQYDSARLALSGYSRMPAASVGVYGAPYPSSDQNPYQSIGVDSSAFYSPLSNPYGLKETSGGTEMGTWTSAGLQPTTGYYSYDPMSAYGGLLISDSRYGASYDLAARRKNATRESTATLKAWLNEHKKNPYPTKGEKIMLAIITKMTLTQVSTWFANARRRLKKENKMTWEPKNRADDDDDALVSDEEKERKEDMEADKGDIAGGSLGKDAPKDDDELTDDDQKCIGQGNLLHSGFGYPSSGYHGGSSGSGSSGAQPAGYHPYHHQHPAYYQTQQNLPAAFQSSEGGLIDKHSEHTSPKNQLRRDCGVPIPATKPKIWSLADTVACKTPPPTYMAQRQQHQQQSMQQQIPPLVHQQQESMDMNLGQAQQSAAISNAHLFNGAPYLRPHTTAYGGFLGATTQQLHTTNSSPYTSIPQRQQQQQQQIYQQQLQQHFPIVHQSHLHPHPHLHLYPHSHHMHQHPQIEPQQQQSQSTVSQRAMGFPEAQPDTPPQTPPNMKVLSGALNLLPTASQVPMTVTCRNSNVNDLTADSSSNYRKNFSTRLGEFSPRDDFSSGSNSSSSSSSSLSPQLHRSEPIFKPLFKKYTN